MMTRLDACKSLIADLARPFSIVATSLSAAIVPVIVAVRATPDQLDLVAAAAFVGALYAGVSALYWGKSWEQAKVATQNAEVEKVRAKAASTAEPELPLDGGELPPDQRVQP